MFKWLKQLGGIKGMASRNAEKAGLLYHAIEASEGFYHTHIDAPYRSRMNVVFRLKDEALEETS